MMRFLSFLMIVVFLTCSTAALSQDKTTDNKATTTTGTQTPKGAPGRMCGKCCCGMKNDAKAMKCTKAGAKGMKCDSTPAKEASKEAK